MKVTRKKSAQSCGAHDRVFVGLATNSENKCLVITLEFSEDEFWNCSYSRAEPCKRHPQMIIIVYLPPSLVDSLTPGFANISFMNEIYIQCFSFLYDYIVSFWHIVFVICLKDANKMLEWEKIRHNVLTTILVAIAFVLTHAIFRFASICLSSCADMGYYDNSNNQGVWF